MFLVTVQIDLKGNIKNDNKSKQKVYLGFNEEFDKHNFNDLTELFVKLPQPELCYNHPYRMHSSVMFEL